jgi:signal peptidase I
MTRKPGKRAASRLLGLTLLLAGWLLFAPTQLGGSASYVIVAGASMEPLFEEGDLVVLRRAERYEVGEVAAYRSPELPALVLHRIVGRQGDRYVLRGDGNSFRDPVRPRASEFLGRPWITVPGAGPVLRWTRKPINAAALSALAVLLALGWADSVGHRRRRDAPERRSVWLNHPPAPSEAALAALAAVGGALVLVGLFAFAQPATRQVSGAPFFEHSASFGYEARVARSAVYPAGTVRPPDPVFLRLVPAVTVRVDYRVAGPDARDIMGRARLDVELRGANDWRRTVALVPPIQFAGDRISLHGLLDLRGLRRIAGEVERLTGTRSDTYELRIVPRVDVRGTVGSETAAETFAPPLVLRLDPLELRLDAGRPGNGLVRAQARETMRTGPNLLSLPGLRVEVRHARLAAVPGAALLLLAAVLWLAPIGRPARIRSRYGPWLVDVTPHMRSSATVVEVPSMDDLARLAEHYGRAILHEEAEDMHRYVVEEDGRAYVHTVRPAAEDSAARTALAVP